MGLSRGGLGLGGTHGAPAFPPSPAALAGSASVSAAPQALSFAFAPTMVARASLPIEGISAAAAPEAATGGHGADGADANREPESTGG
jgi:hypothetical protein